MTQISRPFQIALAALVVLLGVWLIALRGHSSGSSSSSSNTSAAPASTAATSASSGAASASQGAPGGGTPASAAGAYHGSAPGVAGLTRSIEKARGAVKLSERNARQLQQKSAQASSAAPQSAAAAASGSAARLSGAAHSSSPASPAATAAKPSVSKPASPVAPHGGSARASAPAKQPLVEGELQHGRTVLVLFWNPKSSVDVAVRVQLALLQVFLKHTATRAQNRDIAVHYSSAAEVGQYGTITRSLQVLQTPTLLVIAPNGKTKTLTGLVDAYTIRQAIKEARLR
ncbi:MAG: hypothetical protein QOF54_899 [Solirubrobacteraceae bacterium]|jgi:hypothetical protein|nr:hypothetical protein [Solirubrobacteraceae bacterium]